MLPARYLFADFFAQFGILTGILNVCLWLRYIPSINQRLLLQDQVPLWFGVSFCWLRVVYHGSCGLSSIVGGCGGSRQTVLIFYRQLAQGRPKLSLTPSKRFARFR